MRKPRQPWPVPPGLIRRIEECMAEQDISKRGLSLKAGRSDTLMRDILQKDMAPRIDSFLQIAQALGVSPGWLLTGEGEKHGKSRKMTAEEQSALAAIPPRLAAARAALRILPDAFAELVGVPEYPKIEAGQQPASLYQLMQICLKGGLSMDYVCLGDTSDVSDELAAALSALRPAVITSDNRGVPEGGDAQPALPAPGSGSTHRRTRSSA